MIKKGKGPPATKEDDPPARGETQDDDNGDDEDPPPGAQASGSGLVENHTVLSVRRTRAPPEAIPTDTQNGPGDMETEEMKEKKRKLAGARATDLKSKDGPDPK